MNARDQADSLHASPDGPEPRLDDFDPANHTIREQPEELNRRDLNSGKTQKKLSKSGSKRNYLRLVYARKARRRILSGATSVGRNGKASHVVYFWDLKSRSWVSARSIAGDHPDANAKSSRDAELIQKKGHSLENKTRRLGNTCGVPYLEAHYSPSERRWTGQAYMPSGQPTPELSGVVSLFEQALLESLKK